MEHIQHNLMKSGGSLGDFSQLVISTLENGLTMRNTSRFYNIFSFFLDFCGTSPNEPPFHLWNES
jgi:hypothetical protein